jgi:hypothetical protein
METQFKSTRNKIEKLKLFDFSPEKIIISLKNLSTIFFLFSFAFLGAFIFKWFSYDSKTSEIFKLVISSINIHPIYKTSQSSFVFISIYEIVQMLLVVLTFFYFIKFLKSLNMNEPFKNTKSGEYINLVGIFSVLFFIVNTITTIHLSYFINLLPGYRTPFALFHFEYLFLAYFINVFAVIFKRGVDLNNEIDLVI